MVQLTVGTGADLIAHSGLQIDEHATGHMLASTSLGEKGVEGIISATDGLVGGHLAVRLDAVLEAVKFPAGVAGLNTGLTCESQILRNFEILEPPERPNTKIHAIECHR